MSNQSPFGGRQRNALPTIPRGEAIASFETYVQAQQAVDALAKADFPVDRLSILGSDLKTVERVTGKLSWGRVAVAGAASGAWLGVFFGLLLVIFSPSTNLGFVLAAVLIGAGFGMLFGLVSYAVTRRRRDYTSMTQVLATSYVVIVDPELVNRARNVIAGAGQAVPDAPAGYSQPAHPSDPPPHPSDPPPARSDRDEVRPAEPPRYGEHADLDPEAPREAPRYGEQAEPGADDR